nr:hypothetical protein [Tanacetum cinerariifolium]
MRYSTYDDGELLKMDPYEDVAQQGQVPPLSPTYMPYPMELDEHVPVYVPKPEYLEYYALSDDDIQVEDQPHADDASPIVEAPRSQYDFVNTVEAGHGLIRSPGHNARTIARVADRAEDVGYVKALHASEHMMMTSIEEVNLRISYQAKFAGKSCYLLH